MDLKLANKVAVVTGASKGIGLAIVRKFIEEGASVVAVSRTLTEELADLVEHKSVKHLPIDVNMERNTVELSILNNNEGAIVNISSVNARMPELLLPIYGTTKAALNNLTKMLAGEFGPRNIRVNSISPGPVVTPLWQDPDNGMAKTIGSVAAMDSEKVFEELPKMAGITLGKFAEAGDIANLTVFLASERASMITGADYVIDGNMIKTI
ncbi:SDR family NAD(P)-dependent oxidoreductase [Paenibacillus hubeiensis]|uniref:SDR family NAD(P)-dependent oxidoreductase n=1 Tax=Paenibacillus hubeiensis TaxID=3077330 RepID=UPI0031BA8D7B